PVDKHDLDNAKLLINLGYPKVKPILYDIIDWIGDINWPVAKIFLPFLSSIGKECNDVIQKIFESNDGMLKYNVIQYVIPNMKKEDSKFFIPILKKLQKNLTEDDKKEEVDLAILEAIEEIESL
ncbi:MAG: DUF5071 domain-containing protein, partial [Leptospiraceae bacterium]|nr:DUF5071 domain-containing protein [Leptospiraceae bacterium]